jgi:hypothetical protein
MTVMPDRARPAAEAGVKADGKLADRTRRRPSERIGERPLRSTSWRPLADGPFKVAAVAASGLAMSRTGHASRAKPAPGASRDRQIGRADGILVQGSPRA